MAVRIILLAALAWGISGGILNGNESQDFKIGTGNKSLEPGVLLDEATLNYIDEVIFGPREGGPIEYNYFDKYTPPPPPSPGADPGGTLEATAIDQRRTKILAERLDIARLFRKKKPSNKRWFQAMKNVEEKLGQAQKCSEKKKQKKLKKDEVVVDRKNIKRFLSTEDEIVPGNMGLKDQNLAMKWVKENIEYFGGNPNSITLFGLSAGAASTHYHILSPYSKDLFKRAIMQSGSALCPWAAGRDFRHNADIIAKRFDCPTNSSSEMISCLQNINAHLIDDILLSDLKELKTWNTQPFIFSPRVDGDFIPDEPVALIKRGDYNHVPVIMGISREEGAIESGEMYTLPFIIDSLHNNFSRNAPISLHLFEDEEPVDTANEVYNFYLENGRVTFDNAYKFTQLISDRLFFVAHDLLTQLTADQDEVYTYEFHHRGQYGLTGLFRKHGLNLTEADHWIAHSDESTYLFERKHQPLNTTADLTVRNIHSSALTNFAKFGSPTPDDSMGFKWKANSATSLEHLTILPEPHMDYDTREQIRAFWASLPLRINQLINS
ncbi:unnamed protein product, partial [Meganyctiphanes norvegica]